jgi:hypothetical protein
VYVKKNEYYVLNQNEVMILNKITPQNITTLGWSTTIYILEEPIQNPEEKPLVSQILPFFQLKIGANQFLDNLYFANSIVYG